MKKSIALTISDFRNITRDPMLAIFCLVPLFMALFIRYVLPWGAELILVETGFNLMDHYFFVSSFLVLVTPLMIGTMTGFIVLDERDAGTLSYYNITPLSKSGYLTFRLVTPIVLSTLITLLALLITVGAESLPLGPTLLVVLLGATEAPLMVLFLAAFAGNKVEGLAFSKATGVLMLAPIVGYALKSSWKHLAGLMPPYWLTQAYVAMGTPAYWGYLLVGAMVHVLYLRLLLHQFNQRVE